MVDVIQHAARVFTDNCGAVVGAEALSSDDGTGVLGDGSEVAVGHVHAILLAGGRGERLRELYTSDVPKPFIRLLDPRRTMIQMTAGRLRVRNSYPRVHWKNMWVLARSIHRGLVKGQLTRIPHGNIITEPFIRTYNTLPIVAAMHYIAKRDPDALAIVLPTDHFIGSNRIFLTHIRQAISRAVTSGALVAFGIEPDFPSPEYGYIKYDRRSPTGPNSHPVEKFVEKPSTEVAATYLKQGGYLWNGGMYVWRVRSFFDIFRRYQPAISDAMQEVFARNGGDVDTDFVEKRVEGLPDLSIDRSLMEFAASDGCVEVVPFKAGWSDAGTIPAMARLIKSRAINPPARIKRLVLELEGSGRTVPA